MKSCMCMIWCNKLRVNTLYNHMNMFATKGQETHDGIIEFKFRVTHLARGYRVLKRRCSRCCFLIWTASMMIMKCVWMPGMDWFELDHQLVWQLHLATSWKVTPWFSDYRSCTGVWIAFIWCIWCVRSIHLVWIALYLQTRWWLALEAKWEEFWWFERKACIVKLWCVFECCKLIYL